MVQVYAYKMHQNTPGPAGELKCPPYHLAAIGGLLLRGVRGREAFRQFQICHYTTAAVSFNALVGGDSVRICRWTWYWQN